MEQLVDLIVQAAQRIGFEAARVWPDLVALTFVQSAFYAFGLPLVGITFLLLTWFVWRAYDTAVGEYDRALTRWRELPYMEQAAAVRPCDVTESFAYRHFVFAAVLGVAGMIALTVALFSAPTAWGGLAHPEAQTILNMMREFKSR